MIIRYAYRIRLYVRGYENDKYLKELSIERILNHDYNTRERESIKIYRRETLKARPLREEYYYTTYIIEKNSRLY